MRNICEANVTVKFASQLTSRGQSFRIVTPYYDPRRSFLETSLKNAGLAAWEDKCFSIDSFQGSHFSADYFIPPNYLYDRKRRLLYHSRPRFNQQGWVPAEQEASQFM